MRTVARVLLGEDLSRVVRVVYSAELGEYTCQLILDGRHYAPADAFETDRTAAMGTARAMLRHPVTH